MSLHPHTSRWLRRAGGASILFFSAKGAVWLTLAALAAAQAL